MKNFIRVFLISISTSFCLLAQVNVLLAQTASILPQAETQFLDNNGKPVTSGTVDFYIPDSTTRKTTWQDANMTVSNANPVKLDAAGRALIYGYGGYREVLKDRNGNLIWDRVTNSYSIPNGQVTTGDGNVVGTILPWSGLTAPTQYIFAYGQELSRVGYSALFSAITLSQTGNCTVGSNVVSGIADTSQIPIGTSIESSCFSGSVTVSSKTSTSYTVSANSVVTASGVTLLAFPYGNGNGTTTYNVPDFRGRTLAGRDNMGGIAATRLTSAYFGHGADGIGATGGNEDNSLITSNLPPYTPSGTVSKPTATAVATVSGLPAQGGTSSTPVNTGVGSAAPLNAGTISVAVDVSQPTFTGTAQGGTGLPFGIVQPTITINYIIKVIPDQTGLAAAGVLSVQTMAGALTCDVTFLCASQNLGLALAPNNTILANISGSSAKPLPVSPSAVLDHYFSGIQGSILYRDVAGWAPLAPGTPGFVLSTAGSAANPLWIANTNPSTPQPANTFSSGPITGANAPPTFRYMIAADLPKGLVVTPEMFGGGCTTLGADNGPAIQAAIDYLGAHAGGTVLFSPCLYAYTTPIVISHQGTSLVGMQYATGNGTELYFTPISGQNECAISLNNGAIISDVSIKNLAIRSPDTTIYKKAICITDGSVINIKDVFIWSWTGGHTSTITGAVANGSNEIRLTVADAGTNWGQGWAATVAGVVGTTNANSTYKIAVVDGSHIDLKGSTFNSAYVSGGTITAMSTGLQVQGREFIYGHGLNITADLPLQISTNPHNANNSLDQSSFRDFQIVAPLNTAPAAIQTACNILIDDGSVLSDDLWDGNQSWAGGKDGVCWRDKSAPAVSETVSFNNVRLEQKSVSGGWMFDIQPHSNLYSLSINNNLFSDRDGVRARNVVNMQLNNPHFISAQTCMDLDSSVVSTSIDGAYSIAGSTLALSGQTKQSGVPNTGTGCLPQSVQFSKATTTLTNAASATVLNYTALRALAPGEFNSVFVNQYGSVSDIGGGLFLWDAANVSADNDGTIIAPGAGGTGRWVRFNPNPRVEYITWFGGVADNSTDNCTPLTNAYGALSSANPTSGGKIIFPQNSTGIYKSSCGLTITKNNVSLEGQDTAWTPNTGINSVTFSYNGGVASPLFDFSNTQNFTVRGITFVVPAAYAGTVFGGNNAINFTFEHNSLQCGPANTAGSAQGISLDQVVVSQIKYNSFYYCSIAIIGQKAGHQGLSTNAEIKGNIFSQNVGYSIVSPGVTYWIKNNAFEPAFDGSAKGIAGTSGLTFVSLDVSDNFFGDVSLGGQVWINLTGGFGLNIANNFIGGNGATDFLGISTNNISSLNLANNYVENIRNFLTTTSPGIVLNGTITNNIGATVTACFNVSSSFGPAIVRFGNRGFTSQCENNSIGATGYRYNVDGTLEQWGVSTVTTSVPLAVTFPTTFPNACINAQLSLAPGSAVTNTASFTIACTTTGTTLNVSGGAGTNTVYWRVLGN